MDGWIDQRTDRPSYRDARTHLKMIGSGVGGIELVVDGFSKKGNGRTDGRTDPLIEMRGRIQKMVLATSNSFINFLGKLAPELKSDEKLKS